jgi:SAM-dependent methyltransferase
MDFIEIKSSQKKSVARISKKLSEQCTKLFKKIRHPDKKLIHRPPLRKPPSELLLNFTDNGKMPIRNEFYCNEVYSDSDSEDSQRKIQLIIKNDEFLKFRDKVRKREPLDYEDKTMTKKMFKYESEISGKSVAVIGTWNPWVEAIAYEVGAARITTLDYTRKGYEDSSRLQWVHVNDFLDSVIESGEFESFDNIASFSSIEHSGLGRYGDPLAPFGDLEAVQQVNCMLKPGGLFFLGLPVSRDESSYIEFNAHRMYGKYRLELLFNGWKVLEEEPGGGVHRVFVLRKL